MDLNGYRSIFKKKGLDFTDKESRLIFSKLGTLRCTDAVNSAVFKTMSSVYEKQGALDSAIYYQKKSVHFSEKHEDKVPLGLEKLGLIRNQRRLINTKD